MKPSFSSEILPGWIVMWILAIGIYVLLKGISWCMREQPIVAGWKCAAYLVGWPGMDVDTFLNAKNRDVPQPKLAEWRFAFLKLCFGLNLFFGIVPRLATFDPGYAGWTGMVGVIFSFHFGLFHVLSLFWRIFGLQAVPIMDWPIASQSLAEFWGRRWNRAFRDLTHRLLFRPLIPRIGSTGSLLTGFLVSGLIHDLVISVPARGGLGGPTAFFVIQGFGIIAEKSRLGRFVGLGRGIMGRMFCAACLLGPVSLLFHRPFVGDVMVPFLYAMRCLS